MSNELFQTSDIDVLSQAISIHPNLEFACYATILAKKTLKFPINSHADVAPLFEVKSLPKKISQRKIRLAHFKKFFPVEFFPIIDSSDFLGKVLAALSWGANVHYHEQFQKNPVRFTPKPYHIIK